MPCLNVVMHFLGDRLICGEDHCHWRFGAFHTEQTQLTRGNISMDSHDQADIIMYTIDNCSGNIVNCVFYYEDN